MIKVNNNQQLIKYIELNDMTIDEHIKVLNEATPEISLIYLWNCVVNSELLEIQKRLQKIKDELVKKEINKRTNEYIIRMNKLQFELDNKKLEEYIENLSYIELTLHIYDFKEDNVELTEQGIAIARVLNKKLESIPSTLEPIQIEQKKK